MLLLKVDAEGFDSHVLRGAARLLREQRAVFLTFEYNVCSAVRGTMSLRYSVSSPVPPCATEQVEI